MYLFYHLFSRLFLGQKGTEHQLHSACCASRQPPTGPVCFAVTPGLFWLGNLRKFCRVPSLSLSEVCARTTSCLSLASTFCTISNVIFPQHRRVVTICNGLRQMRHSENVYSFLRLTFQFVVKACSNSWSKLVASIVLLVSAFRAPFFSQYQLYFPATSDMATWNWSCNPLLCISFPLHLWLLTLSHSQVTLARCSWAIWSLEVS